MKDVYEEAAKRKNEKCDIPLNQVMKGLGFTEKDYKNILELIEKKEI